jgi:hypothetical protein
VEGLDPAPVAFFSALGGFMCHEVVMFDEMHVRNTSI